LWDKDIVSQSNGKNIGAFVTAKRVAPLSDEVPFDALQVKVMRTLISPELV
jgi:hypothetical protein